MIYLACAVVAVTFVGILWLLLEFARLTCGPVRDWRRDREWRRSARRTRELAHRANKLFVNLCRDGHVGGGESERGEHIAHARQVARNHVIEMDRWFHGWAIDRPPVYLALREGLLAWDGLWASWWPSDWCRGVDGDIPRVVWSHLESVSRSAVR